MNVGDLRRNSGECQGGAREYGVVGSPKFARVRQTSQEGAHMLLVHPGTCPINRLRGGKVSARLRVVSPGNPSCAFRCLGGLSASWRSLFAIMYGNVLRSCLICKMSLLLSGNRGGKRQNNSLGSQLSLCILNAIALPPGAVTLVGELRLLGTKVPWGDSPERRGGPWAPPPRGVLLKAVLSLCLFFC